MPIGMKRELTEKAKRMGMKGERADRYIFGGLRGTGWKPGLRAGGRPIEGEPAGQRRGVEGVKGFLPFLRDRGITGRLPSPERERVTVPPPEGAVPEEPARRRRPIQTGGIPAYRERAEGIIRRRPTPQRMAEERPVPQRERPVPQGVDWEGARGEPRMRIGGRPIPQRVKEHLLRRREGATEPTPLQGEAMTRMRERMGGRARTRMGFPTRLKEFMARMRRR
ncbi:MAG: hypothetical protein DDT19_00867 [Syntrophomonadaceae bacterium]|nr:hypothetical protein [Bacillota bacterium]